MPLQLQAISSTFFQIQVLYKPWKHHIKIQAFSRISSTLKQLKHFQAVCWLCPSYIRKKNKKHWQIFYSIHFHSMQANGQIFASHRVQLCWNLTCNYGLGYSPALAHAWLPLKAIKEQPYGLKLAYCCPGGKVKVRTA